MRGATTIKRSVYGLVGRAIATRVSGDPVSGNNSLFYYLTDHLGSTSVLLTSSNGIKGGSTTRYHPFGSYRGTAPSQTITDRHYTGHAHNDDLGLVYMNARYYLSYINQHPFHHQARMSGVFVDVANFVGQDVILSRQISDLPYYNFLTEDAGPAIS